MSKIENIRTSQRLISIADDRVSSEKYDFLPGEVVDGLVIKKNTDGIYLLELNGKRLSARTSLSLKEGMKLKMKVMKLHPLPSLKILSVLDKREFHPDLSAIITGFSKNPWKEVYETLNNWHSFNGNKLRLRSLMQQLTIELYKISDPELLRKILINTGLFFESKIRKFIVNHDKGTSSFEEIVLQDVKGLISQFIKQGIDIDGKLQSLRYLIENMQILNIIGLEREGLLFVPLPVVIDGRFSLAHMLIDFGDETEGSPEKNSTIRVLFLLEMSQLGPLRIELSIFKKKIKCIFFVTSKESGDFISNDLDGLKQRFLDLGFIPEEMSCHILDEQEVTKPLLIHIMEELNSTISIHA